MSGGADAAVSVWTWDLTQKFTFSHAGAVHAVACNPIITGIVASAGDADFCIWNMANPTQRKTPLPSRALCAAWTSDGQLLALGLLSGVVSIRDGAGVEHASITRGGPVWDIAIGPLPPMPNAPPAAPDEDVLTLVCWDGTLASYGIDGGGGGNGDTAVEELPVSLTPLGRDRDLGAPPQLCPQPSNVCLFGSSGCDFLVVSGSDRTATLMTREGVRLVVLAAADAWVWRVVSRPRASAIAVAAGDGSVALYNVSFPTVHGLYGDRYAFRDSNCADVMVQHLVSGERARIKCRDYIRKIALYRDRLAVQVSDRIMVYEVLASSTTTGSADANSAPEAITTSATIQPTTAVSLNYALRERITAAAAQDCSLLVVTAAHVVLCLERRLQAYNLSGTLVREWALDAPIRYIKVCGGPAGREALLVGLKSGAVLKVFVHSALPLPLITHGSSIRCLDLSASRRKLAVVDEASRVTVYDLGEGGGGGASTPRLLFSEAGANSVAWNSEAEDSIAYSGMGALSIKTGAFPPHTQRLAGFVVGFAGARVFVLQHALSMTTIDVPQSASLARYVGERAWDAAYRTACLGVTEADWRSLGTAALEALQLPVARAAFARVGDVRALELCATLEAARRAQLVAARAATDPAQRGPDSRVDPRAAVLDDAALLAEVAAHNGAYAEAAALHLRSGSVDRAVAVFADLQLWTEARAFLERLGAAAADADAHGGGGARLRAATGALAELLLRQASACEEAGDAPGSAAIYLAAGRARDAVRVLVGASMLAEAHDVVLGLPNVAAASSPATAAGTEVTETAAVADARAALRFAVDAFTRADRQPWVRECLRALGDHAALARIHIAAGDWAEAEAAIASMATVGSSGNAGTMILGHDGAVTAAELTAELHAARARAFMVANRFVDAQRAFALAGMVDAAADVHAQLLAASIAAADLSEASICCVHLAREARAAANRSAPKAATVPHGGDDDDFFVAASTALARLADVYAAAAIVRGYTRMPFSRASSSAIYCAGRVVMAAAAGWTERASASRLAPGPRGAPILDAWYAVARQLPGLGACHAARAALGVVTSQLHLPAHWRDAAEAASLAVRTTPDADDDAIAATACFRCGMRLPILPILPPAQEKRNRLSFATPPSSSSPTTSRLRAALTAALTATGVDDATRRIAGPTGVAGWQPDAPCTGCGAALVRSPIDWELLPLVEFTPSTGISHAEAKRLILLTPTSDAAASAADDRFQQLLGAWGARHNDSLPSGGMAAPLQIPADVLRDLDPAATFVIDDPAAVPLDASCLHMPSHDVQMQAGPRYFKNVLPDVAPIVNCNLCSRFFQQVRTVARDV